MAQDLSPYLSLCFSTIEHLHAPYLLSIACMLYLFLSQCIPLHAGRVTL